MRPTLSLRWFTKLPIQAKLLIAFGAQLLLAMVLGGFSIYELGVVKSTSDDLATRWMPGVGHTAKARAAILDFRTLEGKHSRAEDTGYMDEYEEKMKAQRATVEQEMAAYEALGVEVEQTKLLQRFKKLWGEYMAINQKVVGLGRSNKQMDAQDIAQGAALMGSDDAISTLDKLTGLGFQKGSEASATATSTYQQARMLVMVLLAIALLTGALLAWVIARDLLKTLGGEPALAHALTSDIAKGQLYMDIQLKSNDRESLLSSIRDMRDSLAHIVSQVRSRAEDIALHSQEIAQGNTDLSNRTEQQAQDLQTTTSAMEHVNSMVHQNAQGAQTANQLAKTASQVAREGGEVVAKVVDTMKGIHDSSRKIGDIISVIDGIAFQTNILALNAAVEAARAGEQGRGFAVVASEVRSLAGRSAAAAKEIKALISASVERVEEGNRLVDRAGQTMVEVVGSIQRVTDLMQDISAASEEQNRGVAKVGESIQHMDEATQQNSALVEEMAASTAKLAEQSRELVGIVSVFVLDAANQRQQLAAPST
jgi:methyl-accepting chemotaxis protein